MNRVTVPVSGNFWVARVARVAQVLLLSALSLFSLIHLEPAFSQVGVAGLSADSTLLGAQNQFAPFRAPPAPFDNVQGEWVNLETQLIKPIIVTPGGQYVVVANDADNRVVFLDADLGFVAETVVGQGIAALAARNQKGVGTEVWVTLRHQSAVVVIETTTFRVTHLLRPPIPAGTPGAGLASFPGGIAFNAARTKAYVPSTFTDSVLVYDARDKTYLRSIPLVGSHNGRQSRLNDPFAVVEYGGAIYVASHLSGSNTVADNLDGNYPGIPGVGAGALGPDDVVIANLDEDPGRSLPDFCVARIDPVTDSVTELMRGLGSVIFGIVAHPASDRIVVSCFKSRNGEFIGESAFPDGRVVSNRIAHFRVDDPVNTTAQLLTENLGPDQDDVVMPTDMATDASGRFYVAGYCSANIGVLLGSGTYFGTIATDEGPRGLAIHDATDRLYCFNRAAGTVTCYDISSADTVPDQPLFSVTLPDPTYDDVKEGRKVFLTPNSGAGTTGCFSCHMDARKDGLGWQLSKVVDPGDGFTLDDPPTEWRDLKGVMVTQDLRSLGDVPPYHWRGEQKDLEDFNGAFVGLLKGALLDPDDMRLMKAYVFSTVYPANPFQQLNRVYSQSAMLGFAGFTSDEPNGDGQACSGCHALPTGTDCSVTEAIPGFNPSPRTIKTAQLRGSWAKDSDLTNIDDDDPGNPALWPSTGFGFAHEGLIDTVPQFNSFFFGNSDLAAAGFLPHIDQFLREFDTGLAPVTMFSARLDQNTPPGALQIRNYLLAQAIAGNCDVVVRGRVRLAGVWIEVGMYTDENHAPGVFTADDSSLGAFTFEELRVLAVNGDAELLVLGVPARSGERIGVDRDRDQVKDQDELAQGLDPLDPDSDGDGLWDGYDPEPDNPQNMILPAGAPQVVPGSVAVVFETANSVKLVYETDVPSPTRVEFGRSLGYGFFTGDPLLPTGPGTTSNLWKRHHTAILRPQPDQGLLGLRDASEYHFRIWTQGQNNSEAVTVDCPLGAGAACPTTLPDATAVNLRAGSIELAATNNDDGTFTYTATVKFVFNDGAPGLNNRCAPARFTTYSGDEFTVFRDAQFTQTVMGEPGVAVFTYTTAVDEQQVGDLTVFDMPMVLDVAPCNPNLDPPVVFPGFWPEGPSADAIEAPPQP